MKKKTYCYENRTFEVEVYDEFAGCMLGIYVNEVIRPNRSSLVALNISTLTMLFWATMPLLMML